MSDKPIKVLLIEDEPGDAHWMREMLESREATGSGAPAFDLECADRLSTGLERLAMGGVDVVLLALSLPDSRGPDTFTQAQAQTPQVPIIVLSDLDDVELAVQAVREGAQDYLVKGQVDSNLLMRSIRYAIEHKRAEEALRESEEKYREILENIEEGYYEVDIAGNLVSFNDSLCRMLGYPKEKLVGLNNREFMDAETAKAVYQVFNQVHQTGKPAKALDWELIRQDGTKRIIEVSVSLISDSTGRPIGFRGIAHDITERKRAEETLAHERDLLHVLMDSIPDTIYFKDAASRFTRVNKAQAQLLGSNDPEEVVGKTDFDFFTPEHAQDAYTDEQGIVQTGQPVVDKIERIRRADGQFRWVSTTKVPIIDQKGRVTGIVGITRDITEREQAEEALRKSEALFHSLIESLPQNVFSKDLEGRFTFANQRYCMTEGKSLADIIGKTDFDLHPPELAKKYLEDDHRVIETEQLFETVEEHQPMGGERFYVQVIKTPVYDSKGQVTGVLGIFWDITESKRAEEEREKLIAELQEALTNIKTLRGLLPICASCKRIRDDEGYWNRLEAYIEEHSEAVFSHSLCDECAEKLYPEFFGDDE